jgi:hypothetical protein
MCDKNANIRAGWKKKNAWKGRCREGCKDIDITTYKQQHAKRRRTNQNQHCDPSNHFDSLQATIAASLSLNSGRGKKGNNTSERMAK